MAALPLVLAGPILRRVEPGRVTVWIALSAPADVSLHIFEGREESTGPGTIAHSEPILSRKAVPTWRFGERLHIAVVEASMPAEAGGVDSDGRGVDWTSDAPRPAAVVGPPPAPLQPGAMLCYDVVVTRDGEDRGLLALGLLSDDPVGGSTTRSLKGVDKAAPAHLALGYADKVLPSFVVPAAEVDKICLAHASCRKIHGPGTDAMSFLDAEVEEHIDDPGKRVQQLYLTGDQIYADDVGATILPVIHDLAVQLNLPDISGADTPDHLAKGMEELPNKEAKLDQYFADASGVMGTVNMQTAGPLRRSKIVRRDAGFTSTGATNHLMTFAEYAALYLLAWSPRVWKLPADDDRVFEHSAAVGSPFSQFDLSTMIERETGEDLRAALDRRFGQGLEGERQRIKVYAATVAKVARLLANTPTYMIFDDHDVTDDWNINAVFMQRVYARPMGRMVVREALTAYLAFQGIGNDVRQYSKAEALRAMPRKFTKHPTSNEAIEIAQQPIERADYEFLNAATKYLATPRNRPRVEAKKLDTLFGFPESGSSDPDKRLSFHYRLHCGLYDVLVLDSRTRRTFDGMLYGPSQLLGDTLEDQVPRDPSSGVKFNLVVSSTPILGPELFERIALPALITIKGAKKPLTDFERTDEVPEQGAPDKDAARRTRGALDMDLETWSANEAGQHELLERLTNYHPVIMLGGDVHHAETIAMDFWRRGEGASPDDAERALFVQLTSSAARNAFDKTVEAVYSSLHWVNHWIAGPKFYGVGWREAADVNIPADAYVPSTKREKLKERPAIVSASRWPEGSSFKPDRLPDWWFEVSTVHDQRPNDVRGEGAKPPDKVQAKLDVAYTQGPGLARAKLVAQAHALAKSERFAPLRAMVMTNNVGVIQFKRDGDTVKVVHRLLSSTKPDYDEDDPDPWPPSLPLGSDAKTKTGDDNTLVEIALERPKKKAPELRTSAA